MSNQATKMILEAVNIIKSNAKKAEEEFDRKSREIQRMASSSIDLFGGSASKDVVKLASESRKACDKLYAVYQSSVGMLDEQCRQILNDDVDIEALWEVKELIIWLNDESEIENNFTASLNDRNLGNVANVAYIPTIENKMIQSFWETKYSFRPEKEEFEKVKAQEKEIERQAAEKRRLEKEAAEKAAMEAKREARRKQMAEEAKVRAETNTKVRNLVNSKESVVSISSGDIFTVAVCQDGKILITGRGEHGQDNVVDWENVVSASVASLHTVGLKFDGTVVAKGKNSDGQCNVATWRDIVYVDCKGIHTVGLKSDGTVVASGYNKDGRCNVGGWKDIVHVACGNFNTVGVRADGTVAAIGSNQYNQCNVEGWTDIVSVACGEGFVVGLKSDGTVVAVGKNDNGQCNVDNWKDVVSIACGRDFTVGLKSDGTVIATGGNVSGQCDVTGWSDIVLITCGDGRIGSTIIGVKANGHVVSTKSLLGDIRQWKLFDDVESLSDVVEKRKLHIEKTKAEKRAKLEKEAAEEKIRAERRAKGVCQYCGGELKGLLVKKCVVCGASKNY